MISPLWWLGASVVAVAAYRFIANQRRHARAARLSALAREARMNYSPLDRFDLAARLQQSPRWTGGLTVRDIIYGASAGERKFVALVERRATADDRPRRLVVACVEHLDTGELREFAQPLTLSRRRRSNDAYRALLAALRGEVTP